jgi:two-component system response regulator AtoC
LRLVGDFPYFALSRRRSASGKILLATKGLTELRSAFQGLGWKWVLFGGAPEGYERMPNFSLSPIAGWKENTTTQQANCSEDLPSQGAESGDRVPDRVFDRLDSERLFVAASPAMREVRRQIEQLAAIDAAVLLFGESGTGKETAARLLHKLSHRSPHRFMKVNCAASPAELLESELFGHELGAFSGARMARSGKLEAVDKGTLLLDDIGGMPLPAQAMLLHFLADGEFSHLGSTSTIHADVRVLAAVDGDLRRALRNGALRPDLYYRLNVFSIHLPPLRERREDLPYLLNHFMAVWAEAYGRPRLPITRRILEVCGRYSWPGNLRELENFIKRYLVLNDEKPALDQIDAAMEPEAPASPERENVASPQPQPRANAAEGSCDLKSVVRGLKQDAERAAIIAALEHTGGNKQEAAGLLRISLRALHYKVRAYHIESTHARTQAAAASGDPVALPRAVGDNVPYERPRSSGGKLISMHRAPSRVR